MLITWKVNVYTCAEIYLIINNVQKFNNHTKPTSKYLECWSCDKEANTAKAGHGLVTFIDVDTGFQDFFKPLGRPFNGQGRVQSSGVPEI